MTFDPGSGLKLRFLDGGQDMQSGISLSTSVRWAGTLWCWYGGGTQPLAPEAHVPPLDGRAYAVAFLGAPTSQACTAPTASCPQVFSHFQAPAPLTFFVPLSVLLESINTVASSMPQELHLQYPGPGGSLLITWAEGWRGAGHASASAGRMLPSRCCQTDGLAGCLLLCGTITASPAALLPHHRSTTEDASTRTTICSYAKIATLAQQDLSSLDDMWDPQDACSQAILPGKRGPGRRSLGAPGSLARS